MKPGRLEPGWGVALNEGVASLGDPVQGQQGCLESTLQPEDWRPISGVCFAPNSPRFSFGPDGGPLSESALDFDVRNSQFPFRFGDSDVYLRMADTPSDLLREGCLQAGVALSIPSQLGTRVFISRDGNRAEWPLVISRPWPP